MSRLRHFVFGFRSLLRRRQIEDEMDEELRFCMEMETEANVRRGMRHDEARRAARLKIGGKEQIKEACRDEWGITVLESLLGDLRYGLRSLFRTPGFTLVAVLTLALGIGANAAMFSVVKAVLLDPLPYPDAGKLVHLISKGKHWRMGLSLPNFEDIRSHQTRFEDLACFVGYTEVNLTGGRLPLRARASRVMPGFFDVVGVSPLIGRSFRDGDARSAKERAVLLSYDTWKGVFGGDVDIVGRKIDIDDEEHVVYGVMPIGFDFPGGKDVWIYWDVEAEEWAKQRDAYELSVVARVSSSVTLGQAQTELDLIWQRLAKEHSENADVPGLELVPEFEASMGKARIPLMVLMGAVVLVLLVVSVNLAGLLLNRGVSRQRELMLRSALGASRFRMIRQLMTETLLLCLPGCALGLVVAHWGILLLAYLFPADSFIYLYLGGVPRLDEAGFDPFVLGFALAVMTAAMFVAGFYPACSLSNPNLQDGLQDGSWTATTSKSGIWIRNVLTVSQVALSLLLLVGAALLFKSYLHLVHVDLGFETENRLTAQTVLSQKRYPTDEAKVHFFRETVDRLQAVPGALHVATTSNLFFSNWGFGTSPLIVEGRPADDEQQAPGAQWFSVSPNFFEVLGVTLLKGRSFAPDHSAPSEPLMIIDRTLEALLFPEGGALGQRISLFEEWRTIVGVVDGIRTNGPLRKAQPKVYVPYYQYPTDQITWVLKTAVPPESLAGILRDELAAVDPRQPVYRIETLDNYFLFSVSKNRLSSLLMSGFGLSALAIACLGLYGVLAFRVTQRTHEIGIRSALGANRREIFGMFVLRGMRLVVIGLVIGNLAALGLTRVLSSLLFGVGSLDAATFITAGGVFLLVGLFACSLPALRAARLDPSSALRCE